MCVFKYLNQRVRVIGEQNSSRVFQQQKKKRTLKEIEYRLYFGKCLGKWESAWENAWQSSQYPIFPQVLETWGGSLKFDSGYLNQYMGGAWVGA